MFKGMKCVVPDCTPLGDAVALATAIRSYLKVPAGERNAAARELANLYSWNQVIKPVVKSIRDWQEMCEFEA